MSRPLDAAVQSLHREIDQLHARSHELEQAVDRADPAVVREALGELLTVALRLRAARRALGPSRCVPRGEQRGGRA